jgi:hypothetical protein
MGGKNLPSVMNKSIKKITPHMGWDKFQEKLNEMRLLEVPKEKSGGADGTTYCIEIASKTKYRFYSLWSPETRVTTSKNAKIFEDLLQVIESEFKFTRIQK